MQTRFGWIKWSDIQRYHYDPEYHAMTQLVGQLCELVGWLRERVEA